MSRVAFYVAICIVMRSAAVVAADAPDQSTPKSAALAFWNALDRGDATGAKALSVEPDGIRVKWIDAFAAMCAGFRATHNAAAERFGQADADRVFARNTPAFYSAKMVASLQPQVDGDEAILILPGKEEENVGIRLSRRDGKWFMTFDASVPEIDDAAALNQALATVKAEVAANIRSGKYKTVQDADGDQRKRVGEALRSVKR